MIRRHHPGCHQPNTIRWTVTNYAVALNIMVIHRQVQHTLHAATTDKRRNPRTRIINRLCHGPDGLSPASGREGPVSIPGQFMWDLLWTEWQWDRLFPQRCSRVCIYPPVFHTDISFVFHNRYIILESDIRRTVHRDIHFFSLLALQPPLGVVFYSPLVGFSLLALRGFLITHNDAPHSVELLWTNDQSVAETSTWQHTTLTTDKYPCPGWDSNPQSQRASSQRPTP